MSTMPGISLKWPFGGTWKGHAPWNSLLPLLPVDLLLGLHAARNAMPAAPPPNSCNARRRDTVTLLRSFIVTSGDVSQGEKARGDVGLHRQAFQVLAHPGDGVAGRPAAVAGAARLPGQWAGQRAVFTAGG